MRVHRATGAMVAVAAVVLGTTTLSASASSSPPSPRQEQAEPDAVVVDCAHQPQVRPGGFLQGCADGTLQLTDLRWARWDRQAATGSGRQVVNECEPDCVTGQPRSYPVTVTLEDPRPWPDHPGLQHYTRLSVTYTADRPALWESLWQQQLWN